MEYVTKAEVNNFMSISWEDVLVSELIKYAWAIVENYCNVDWFIAHDVEKEYHYKWNWPYYLEHSVVNSIEEINDVVFSWNYKLLGRALTISRDENVDVFEDEWYNVKFKYNVWYENIETIPEKIKLATLLLVSELYSKRKSQWVQSFTVWDLSAIFSWSEKELSKFKTFLSPYVVHNVVWVK